MLLHYFVTHSAAFLAPLLPSLALQVSGQDTFVEPTQGKGRELLVIILSKTVLTQKTENLGEQLRHSCDHLHPFVPFVNKTFITYGIEGQIVTF